MSPALSGLESSQECQTADSTFVDALWVAQLEGLLKVDAPDGSLLLQILVKGVGGVASDLQGGA